MFVQNIFVVNSKENYFPEFSTGQKYYSGRVYSRQRIAKNRRGTFEFYSWRRHANWNLMNACRLGNIEWYSSGSRKESPWTARVRFKLWRVRVFARRRYLWGSLHSRICLSDFLMLRLEMGVQTAIINERVVFNLSIRCCYCYTNH